MTSKSFSSSPISALLASVTCTIAACGPAPQNPSDAGSDAGPVDAGPVDAGPVDAGPSCTGTCVDGTVSGAVLSVQDSVAREGFGEVNVFIASIPSLCTSLATNQAPKNATLLEMATIVTDSSGDALPPETPAEPGMYSILPPGSPGPNAHGALVWFQRDDASCNISDQQYATSGSITLTEVPSANEKATGSFDLYFGSDQVTGTFDSATCYTIGPAGTCQ